jgi:fumarate reductase subunit C
LDGLLFLTTLAILLVGFVGLRALAASGYSTSYIDFLENIHFLAYALITAAFAFDMIMKVLSIIIGGHKQ